MRCPASCAPLGKIREDQLLFPHHRRHGRLHGIEVPRDRRGDRWCQVLVHFSPQVSHAGMKRGLGGSHLRGFGGGILRVKDVIARSIDRLGEPTKVRIRLKSLCPFLVDLHRTTVNVHDLKTQIQAR